MEITILYNSIYIHDRNANNYSLWVFIYTPVMQINIHYDSD